MATKLLYLTLKGLFRNKREVKPLKCEALNLNSGLTSREKLGCRSNKCSNSLNHCGMHVDWRPCEKVVNLRSVQNKRWESSMVKSCSILIAIGVRKNL